jgi:hypothetical protein
VDVAAAETTLNSLTNAIFGSPAQRRAGEKLYYHAIQDPLVSCMATAGETYKPPSFVDIYAGVVSFPVPDGVGAWTASLDGNKIGVGIAERAAHSATAEPRNPYYDVLSVARKAKYDKALDSCMRQEPPVGTVNFPEATARLDTKLSALVATIESSPGVAKLAATYGPCMAAAGIAVGRYQDLIAAVQRRVDTAGRPVAGKTISAQFIAAASFEKDAAAADVGCRAQIHDEVLAQLAPRLPAFVSLYQKDLALVQVEWAAMIARAATLG